VQGVKNYCLAASADAVKSAKGCTRIVLCATNAAHFRLFGRYSISILTPVHKTDLKITPLLCNITTSWLHFDLRAATKHHYLPNALAALDRI